MVDNIIADRPMIEQDQIALDAATNHIRENIIPVKKGRRCVDGRYDQVDQAGDMGTIARPGADGGYVQVLLALRKMGKTSLTPEEIVDLVKHTVEEMGDEFTIHTDEHSSNNPQDPNIGCGHLAKPSNETDAENYGVDPKDMRKAITYIKELAVDGRLKIVGLKGHHAEKGVIVVTGVDRTVKPKSNTGAQYFIYDKTRDHQVIEQLVPRLDLPEITIDEFKEISDRQLNATLQNLAKGKPIFEVNVDQPIPQVRLV